MLNLNKIQAQREQKTVKLEKSFKSFFKGIGVKTTVVSNPCRSQIRIRSERSLNSLLSQIKNDNLCIMETKVKTNLYLYTIMF